MNFKCALCEAELRKDKALLDAEWKVFETKQGEKYLCRDCIKNVIKLVLEEF